MNSIRQDIDHALRGFARNPGFTTIVVLTLALGIGANTAVFSIVDSVLLKPLPFRDPDRIVNVFRTQPPITSGPISRANLDVWKTEQHVFDDLSGYYFTTFNLTGVDQAERLRGVQVTERFFNLFGLSPVSGRWISAEDDRPGAPPVAILSHGLWTRRFGGDPATLGKMISLNGKPHAVIGIAPPEMNFPGRTDIWTPAQVTENPSKGNYLKILARLKDGVSESQAAAEMNQIAKSLAERDPGNNAGLTVTIRPVLEDWVRGIRPSLLMLTAAVALVLLIAAANTANLLLTRAAEREREIAVRIAVGAGRTRIIRQFLVESLLLSFFGGILGCGLAALGVSVVRVSATGLPRAGEASIDAKVLVFTLVVSAATGILFGLIPAIKFSEFDVYATLKEGTRSGGSSGGSRRTRQTLVTVEIAVSLVLLIGAGLLIVSLKRLTDTNPGFDPNNLLTVSLSLGESRNTKPEIQIPKTAAFIAQVRQRLGALPGVTAVGGINDLPVTGNSSVNGTFTIVGRPTPSPTEEPFSEFRQVTPGYFRAIGIPLLAGRDLSEADTSETGLVVVVNKAFADRYFPNENPLGQRLVAYNDAPSEIVGVVGNARQWGLHLPPDPEIYFSIGQTPHMATLSLVLRAGGDPSGLTVAVRREVAQADPNVPVFQIRPMTQVIEASTAQRRFNMTLMTVFAAVALILSVIGLYGVVSYSVNRQRREIGVRMALGARTADILKLVLGQGLFPTLLGVGLGLVAAFAVTRLMASLLFGVSPTDPLTFAAVPMLLIGTALAACLLPARRAARVDPMTVLRCE